MMYGRYAIFYTPPVGGDLATFGARWLGWDSAAGREVTHPRVEGLNIGALTATPRKYGLHGTLKAPFRLRGTEADLRDAVEAFARTQTPVRGLHMALDASHGFIGLRPVGDTPALNTLAANAVQGLDRFRAPLTEGDIARRRKAILSARQDAQMLRWGYPFIFDDFHFHLTLTGTVADPAPVIAALEPLVAQALPGPLDVDAITLMGEDCDGLFHQLHRAPLG